MWGIAGVEGNGQSELSEVLSGMKSYSQGTVVINGMNIHGKSVREIRENGLAHISEDRMVFGCAGTLSIKENIIADRFRKKSSETVSSLNEKKINQRGLTDISVNSDRL